MPKLNYKTKSDSERLKHTLLINNKLRQRINSFFNLETYTSNLKFVFTRINFALIGIY